MRLCWDVCREQSKSYAWLWEASRALGLPGVPVVPNVPCYHAHAVAPMEDVREEQRRELSRYRADYLAATAPLAPSLLAGALAGLVVYCVPLAVVLGSFVVLRVAAIALAIPSFAAIVAVRAIRGPRPAATVEPPSGGVADTSIPTGVETALEGGGGSEWIAAAGLVFFWPVALLAIGAVLAALHRWQRARRLDELKRTPLDFPIWPGVLLFYALTAASGLLVGIGTFVAVGANVIFAWAGFLIWRRLYDGLLPRFTAPALRETAAAAARREVAYQKRLRETGGLDA